MLARCIGVAFSKEYNMLGTMVQHLESWLHFDSPISINSVEHRNYFAHQPHNGIV